MATTTVDSKANAERSKALELAVSTIEKQFGKGSIMRLGANESLVPSNLHGSSRKSKHTWQVEQKLWLHDGQ